MVTMSKSMATISASVQGYKRLERDRSSQLGMQRFLASNFILVGLLATGSAAIFPVMLHSTLAPENSLTAYAVAANPLALLLASMWWPVGLALTTCYFIFISRRYGGKVSVKRDNQGFY